MRAEDGSAQARIVGRYIKRCGIFAGCRSEVYDWQPLGAAAPTGSTVNCSARGAGCEWRVRYRFQSGDRIYGRDENVSLDDFEVLVPGRYTAVRFDSRDPTNSLRAESSAGSEFIRGAIFWDGIVLLFLLLFLFRKRIDARAARIRNRRFLDD